MTVPFVVYDTCGEILRTGQCPEADVPLQARPEERILVGRADDQRDYVLDGAVVPRPELPRFDRIELRADGIEAATLSGLPRPCRVRIDGVAQEVEDGCLVLTATRPWTHRVEVEAWPYLPYTVEIKAQ